MSSAGPQLLSPSPPFLLLASHPLIKQNPPPKLLCPPCGSRAAHLHPYPPRLDSPPAPLCALQLVRPLDFGGRMGYWTSMPLVTATYVPKFPWVASAPLLVAGGGVLILLCWSSASAESSIFFVYCVLFMLFYLFFYSLLICCMYHVDCIDALLVPLYLIRPVGCAPPSPDGCLFWAPCGIVAPVRRPLAAPPDFWVYSLCFYFPGVCSATRSLPCMACCPLGAHLCTLAPPLPSWPP